MTARLRSPRASLREAGIAASLSGDPGFYPHCANAAPQTAISRARESPYMQRETANMNGKNQARSGAARRVLWLVCVAAVLGACESGKNDPETDGLQPPAPQMTAPVTGGTPPPWWSTAGRAGWGSSLRGWSGSWCAPWVVVPTAYPSPWHRRLPTWRGSAAAATGRSGADHHPGGLRC